MGFNTVAVLFNDQTYAFRNSGQLGTDIADAMTGGWSYRHRDPLATWFGAGQVLSQAHADHYQVVVAGMNGGYSLDYDSEIPAAALDAVKFALERHGYVVRKKTAPAPSKAKASQRRSKASA